MGILNGSVGGTGYTGGLVGFLDGTARVVNSYSFATITGGSNVGGIVGNNSLTTIAASIKTMVMNCMFYGDITGGTTVSPVFGGTNIANLQGGLNTFNYYAYDELHTKAISNNKYNSALAYLADQCYDVVYSADYKTKQGVSQTGTQVANTIISTLAATCGLMSSVWVPTATAPSRRPTYLYQ